MHRALVSDHVGCGSLRAGKMYARRLLRWIDTINLHIGQSVAWLTLAMVLVTVGDVIMRYLFNTGAVFIQELEWHLFGFLFLLAAGYTLLIDGHVRVDIFYARLPERSKAWVDLICTLVFLLPVCAIIIWSSQKFLINSWRFGEGSPDPGGLPARYIIKSIIPLGFMLLALQGIAEIIRNALKIFAPEEPE